MYVASYVVHFRRVKWQAGAKFFMTHLLDGDLASNNFSWQWIASTFAGKPYILIWKTSTNTATKPFPLTLNKTKRLMATRKSARGYFPIYEPDLSLR